MYNSVGCRSVGTCLYIVTQLPSFAAHDIVFFTSSSSVCWRAEHILERLPKLLMERSNQNHDKLNLKLNEKRADAD